MIIKILQHEREENERTESVSATSSASGISVWEAVSESAGEEKHEPYTEESCAGDVSEGQHGEESRERKPRHSNKRSSKDEQHKDNRTKRKKVRDEGQERCWIDR